jgi:NodT family efflux transporter outer membrane factor (OMF) lipoprotein
LGLALAYCAALGGCAVGPSYTRPAPPAGATAPFVSADPAIAAPQGAQDDWWRLYRDPALDDLVQQALRRNTDLRVAAANLSQARALLNQARSGLFPSTSESFGADYGRSALANYAATAQGRRAPNEWIYQAGLDVSYEVDLFGRVRRTIEAAKADAQAAAAAVDAVRVTVAAETTRAYADACAFHEQADVARQTLQIEQQSFGITQRQRDAGASSDFDLERAATLVEQTRAQIPALEGQRRSALFQLAVLTGRPPAQISPQADACAAPPQLVQLIPVGDGAALLRRRPDVARAERQLAAATARVGVAVANLYPNVTLGGSLASAAPNLSGLGGYSAIAAGIGPLISWNFPNLGVALAQTQAAKAAASASLASFDGAVLVALQETEQALATYNGELGRHAALLAARDHSAAALKIAQIKFNVGGESFLDLLDAQRTLADTQTALAVSDGALVTDQITVFKALGGGWQSAPKVTPAGPG